MEGEEGVNMIEIHYMHVGNSQKKIKTFKKKKSLEVNMMAQAYTQ